MLSSPWAEDLMKEKALSRDLAKEGMNLDFVIQRKSDEGAGVFFAQIKI